MNIFKRKSNGLSATQYQASAELKRLKQEQKRKQEAKKREEAEELRERKHREHLAELRRKAEHNVAHAQKSESLARRIKAKKSILSSALPKSKPRKTVHRKKKRGSFF